MQQGKLLNGYREDCTLALAGVFQAARLVQQLARHGRSDEAALAASIGSVLRLDSATTAEVYGGVGGVALGLELLRDKLTGHAGANDLELAQYVVGVLQLERALERKPTMIDAIRRGIEPLLAVAKTGGRAAADADEPARLAARLAELYRMTLSTLSPRISVNGEHGYLANAAIADKVRAALFAGIRSAFLWRQLGGRRWELVLRKAAIARQATRLLELLRHQADA